MLLSKQAQIWMPKWLQNHPAIHHYIHIPKIFSTTLNLPDFRIAVNNSQPIENFRQFLQQQLLQLIQHLYPLSGAQNLERATIELLNQIINIQFWEQPKHQLLIPIQTANKNLSFPIKTSIVKVYHKIRSEANQFSFHLPDLFTEDTFKQYNKRGQRTLVFSTEPEDILAMASRSNWNSCQTLSNDKRENARVIGSALHSGIGITYLTHEQNFQARGEEILTRCLIRLAYDLQNNEQPILLIDQMYPSFDPILIQLFSKIFLDRSPIPVYSVDRLEGRAENRHRFQLPATEIPFLAPTETSFLDAHHLYFQQAKRVNKC